MSQAEQMVFLGVVERLTSQATMAYEEAYVYVRDMEPGPEKDEAIAKMTEAYNAIKGYWER